MTIILVSSYQQADSFSAGQRLRVKCVTTHVAKEWAQSQRVKSGCKQWVYSDGVVPEYTKDKLCSMSRFGS